MRVHRDERPFVCDQCDFRGAAQEELSEHLRDIHSRGRAYPFECQVCGFQVRHTHTYRLFNLYTRFAEEARTRERTRAHANTRTHIDTITSTSIIALLQSRMKSSVLGHQYATTCDYSVCLLIKTEFTNTHSLTRSHIRTRESPHIRRVFFPFLCSADDAQGVLDCASEDAHERATVCL